MTLRKTSWLERAALMTFGACALAVACGVSENRPGEVPSAGSSSDGAAIVPAGAPSVTGGRGGGGGAAARNASMDGARPIAGTDSLPPGVATDGAPPWPNCTPVTDVVVEADAGVEDGDAGVAANGGKTISCRAGAAQRAISCEKPAGSDFWTCECPTTSCKKTCTTRAERPCGFNNCCGVQPDRCPVQRVNAEPPQSCQAAVLAGTQTLCGFVAEGGASVFSACCPVTRPFGCPGGGCFASSDEARAVCPASCVECAATPLPDAIGLGELCARPGDPPCPAGSDCIVRPSVPPAAVGFCSPPCSAFASTPQCQWTSAPTGIRTGCAGPGDGYLSDHCYLIDDGCTSSCPPGFNCQTGGCFPD